VTSSTDFWFAQLDEIVSARSDQRSFHLFAEGQHSDVRAQIYNLTPGACLELPHTNWPRHFFIVTLLAGTANAVISGHSLALRVGSQIAVLPSVAGTITANEAASVELVSFVSASPIAYRIRPGQLEPNEFERAILARIYEEHPSVGPLETNLHVLSREFTGHGSFTNFSRDEGPAEAAETQLGLRGLIFMPGVPNGMGAVLFCVGGRPTCLETYVYGSDHWDGVFDGFSVDRGA
jgi:hypothetical protein